MICLGSGEVVACMMAGMSFDAVVWCVLCSADEVAVSHWSECQGFRIL